MKVMISGAQGVGKTTLLNELKKLHSTWKFYDEVVRNLVKERNIKISELGDGETQSLVMNAHIRNLKNHKRGYSIYDRGVLDCYAHSCWMYAKQKISSFDFIESRTKFLLHIKDYNKIFFIKPEFDIESDGTRSTSKEFQKEINDIFEDILQEYKHIVLTGTTEERLEQFHRALKIKI